MFVGTNDTWQILAHDPSGRLVMILRRPDVRPEPVDDALVERWVEASVERILRSGAEGREALARSAREELSALPRPPAVPAYENMLADGEGSLWVADHRPPWQDGEARTWTVFDPDGRMLGAVRTPPGLRVLRVGGDFILGVGRSDMDVETVRMFGLWRGR